MQEMMNTNYPGASASQPSAPPVLGGQVPGTNSGLPEQRGLTPYFNPMAQQLQSMGRDEDTMLVHMTPGEVKGLQQLAMAHGGSLTINPHTGLPEAGFLKKLLPTLLGAVLAPFTGGLSAALLVGAGYTVATGSLQKGLMAGLGAFGGAGIGNAIANIGAKGLSLAGGQAAQGLAGLGVKATIPGAVQAGAQAAAPELASLGVRSVVPGVVGEGAKQAGWAAVSEGAKAAGTEAVKQGIGQTAKTALANTGAGLKVLGQAAMKNPLQTAQTFGREFASAARGNAAPGSLMYKYAPTAAGFGAFTNVADAMQPDMPKYSGSTGKDTWNYDGPYVLPPREVSYPGADQEGSGENLYFTPSNPNPVRLSSLSPEERKRYGYADGGLAALPASQQFKDLVAFYNSRRPGPITESIKPRKPEKKTATTAATTTAAPATTAVVPATTGTTSATSGVEETLRGRYGPYTLGGGWGNPDFSNLRPLASGGEVNMDDGAFVMDARTVSELGNGSSNAGIEHLQKLGGQPVRGPGDGVSDSVPANIGGRQAARVARDEVIFPARAVRQLGGGSDKRGTQKLYAMMDKAHTARKRAGRGTDTKLRRGLA